jgi:hypothetical protein
MYKNHKIPQKSITMTRWAMLNEKETPNMFMMICAIKTPVVANWVEDQKRVYINVVTN